MGEAADGCGRMREERVGLQERLDELRAEASLAEQLSGAQSALGAVVGAIRGLSRRVGEEAGSARKVLDVVKYLTARVVALLDGSRSGLVDAPARIARVQEAIDRVSAATQRFEQAFVLTEGSPVERLDALSALLGELRDALERLDDVPGLKAFLDDFLTAIDGLRTWVGKVEGVRARAKGWGFEAPGAGLSCWPFGERDEADAELAALEERLTWLDHELLACGDRPGGPPCVGCGEHRVDDAIGAAFDDAVVRAKEKAVEAAGSAAELLACRTSLKRMRELNEQIRELQWALADATRRRHTRKAAALEQELAGVVAERRELQRGMPARVGRYRRAADAYRKTVDSWKEAVDGVVQSAADGGGWTGDDAGHARDCHPTVTVAAAATAPRSPVAPARRRAVAALAVGLVAVIVVIVTVLTGGDSPEPVADVGETSSTSSTSSTGAAAPDGNRAPTVRPIKVTLETPVTTYTVTATDRDGDRLTYRWSKDDARQCGEFTADGATASWSHPHPPCPNEFVHPGVITVVVSDGNGHEVTMSFDGGSDPRAAGMFGDDPGGANP